MKLICESGPLSGSQYDISSAAVIGRGGSNDIAIKDTAVSLVHCRIDCRDRRVFVKDLGSTNGITVNGSRTLAAELRHGDRMNIGSNEFRVEIEGGRSTGVRPVVKNAKSPVPRIATKPGTGTMEVADTKEEQGEWLGGISGSVNYLLKRMIARGGMGSIYEGEQYGAEGFSKRVAIKTILPDHARNEHFVASFVNEAKLVATLVHQNIVQIHHLGRHENGYYIAMELVKGVTLTEFITIHNERNCVSPVDIASFIVSRVCRGLEYAHTRNDESGVSLGLVHRDVSPNNIMITAEGEVKLMDFGVARARKFTHVDDDQYLVGCLDYMSPEQAQGLEVDARSDLYSLGLVYYELLTGERVFRSGDEDIEMAIKRISKLEAPDPRTYIPDLPPPIVDIVMNCLKKDPSDRYGSAGELAYALEYEMYSKGYGPTIVYLADYIAGLEVDGQANTAMQ